MCPAILPAERIGEIGMVQEVEELGAELRAEALRKLPVLSHGEIPVAITRVAKDVTAHRTLRPEGRRNHDGTLVRVTAKCIK